MREKILLQSVKDAVQLLGGNERFPVENEDGKFDLVLKNHVVVTIEN